MKRHLLSALLLVCPFAARAQYGLPVDNEGLTLTYDAADPDGLPLFLTWKPQPDRVYFIETTTDLTADDWNCVPAFYEGNSYALGDPWYKQAHDVEKRFFRVRYIEQQINIADRDNSSDYDHDGILDHRELYEYGTNPLRSRDINGNDLPDDWETANPLDPYNPVDFATSFAAFRRDWSRGCHLAFGPKVYSADSTPIQGLEVYLHGDEKNGILKVTFTDDTRSSVASIRVYPRLLLGYGALVNEDTSVLDAEPCATYTAVTDAVNPALSGLVFTGTNAGGYTARDLLRTYDTSLVPPGGTLPTGATVPMPYRRVVVPLPGGGSQVRRIPAPLAITSLPLTHISPTSFPVVIRDVERSESAYYADFKNPPYPGILIPGSVQTDLDSDGLPVAVRNPSYPWDPYLRYDTFNSPATCRKWFRYSNAMTYAVTGISAPFQPPGAPVAYNSGYYSQGFAPHKNDMHDTHSFTSEMHMTLDYTPETRLHFDSDDDAWVFINGKLVSDFDFGGPHYVDQYTQTLVFADIMAQVGLDAPEGTCRVAIFHADRYSTPAEIRLLSTHPLRPVYTYQVVADSMTNAQITYSFASAPLSGVPIAPTGMLISATTGKITWNLYGLKDGNGQTVVVPSGDYNVTVRVTDNLGNSDEQSFIVTVAN